MKVIEVKVKPGSSRSRLEGPDADGRWTAWLHAPPVDGRANAELIALVAEHFDCAKSEISIQSGAGARIKRLQIGK
jgi:uncharacterized protein (TIGR00251 family)